MGGGKPGNTVITLTVDTDNIQPNEQSIKDNVVFTDNQSDPAENPGHPEIYVSTVIKGSTCTWQGASKNGRDTINITVVAKKSLDGGADILEEITLGDPINEPKVIAKVKNKDIKGPESYFVTFIINKNASQPYTVDPKLQMKGN
ncbi:hypothetical protein DFQ05_0837 [Winogradskyella wandonensis]|uniref:Uncharacterized protein n=1 Tax=Winogradskyella wandonensis TaxID=1442586 RepID=A0A4R1KVU4_9FLAO|nr:hypothetical protein [Winogradskyella wandonensis]TCK69316.1 hypothetical protein DFQ05_0837 [Winogradskyella wandonensis]